jgi:hypothetical protein
VIMVVLRNIEAREHLHGADRHLAVVGGETG